MKKEWRLDDLPRAYLTKKGNIQLLSMGKIYEFGEGCACPINALSSKFLEPLDLRDGEFLIADTDAGIEHFGRGVEKGIDILVVIVDPTQESILLAKKISGLGQQVDRPVYYVLNRVGNQETRDFPMSAIGKERVAAIVPENKEIFMSGLTGSEFNMDVDGIKEIADMLESMRAAGSEVAKGD